MLWEVEIRSKEFDVERDRVCDEFDQLTHSQRGCDVVQSSSRGYIFAADLTVGEVVQLCQTLLVDSLVEEAIAHEVGTKLKSSIYTVLLKPGVMDPVAGSVEVASRDLELPVHNVQTFRPLLRQRCNIRR